MLDEWRYYSSLTNRANFFRRNFLATEHIKLALRPSLEIIQKVLGLPDSACITQEHIDLCEKLSESPVVLPIPVPNSNHVLPFSKVAGPENSVDPSKRTPGIYLLVQEGKFKTRDKYIGQSVHLGNRVKDHGSSKDPRTSSFITDMKGEGLVYLFILTPAIIASLPLGLTLVQFLCVFEQYMFFLHRPRINRVFVATHGVAWSDAAKAAHTLLLGKPVFVYRKVSDSPYVLELVYIFESMGLLSTTFGFDRT